MANETQTNPNQVPAGGLWSSVVGAVGGIVQTGMTTLNKDYQKNQLAIAEANAAAATANASSGGGFDKKYIVIGVIVVIVIIGVMSYLNKKEK